MTHEEKLAFYQDTINQSLQAYQEKSAKSSPKLDAAINYMLLNGGKRLRPVLCYAFCEMFGGKIEDATPLAMAVEMIHTYSLIHDDLPAMDDDELRRGKPTCHLAFDEATAILAGDALLTEAFTLMTFANLPMDKCLLGIRALGEASGKLGMIAGQCKELDYGISTEPRSPQQEHEEIIEIEMLKTGMLIGIPCYLGALTGSGTVDDKQQIMTFGHCLGSAFQIQDDILDGMGNQEKLGKPIGSDAKGNKKNYFTVFGLEPSLKQMHNASTYALSILKQYPDHQFLQWLMTMLIERDH